MKKYRKGRSPSELIRKPDRWDDQFFMDVARLNDASTNSLFNTVRFEFPDYYAEFSERWADACRKKSIEEYENCQKEIARYTATAASEIESRPVEWIYNPYIPRGKLTLIAANPGVGKTFLMCYISARVSRGQPIFKKETGLATITEGQNYLGGEPGKVLYITAEDGAADTIRPRLEWCGADLTKVYIKECETESITFSGDTFRDMVEKLKPDMVICDPFQSFFSEKVDINAPNKTRAQLFPVIQLAKDVDAAIVLICHLNKDRQGGIITRVLGSMDIVGCCRSFLAVGNVPGKKNTRLKFISQEKSSLARAGRTYQFLLDPDRGGVDIIGESDLKFDDYTALERAMRKNSGVKTEEAKQFLMDQLQTGPKPFKDLLKAAAEKNITEWALRNAASEMGIVIERKGFPATSVWGLPQPSPIGTSTKTK